MSAFVKITYINTVGRGGGGGGGSAKFGNEAHFLSVVPIVASRNGTLNCSNFDI